MLPIPIGVNALGQPPGGVELNFVTDDVSAAFEQAVAAGATVVAPPTEKPWGHAAYVRDPHGVLIHLSTR